MGKNFDSKEDILSLVQLQIVKTIAPFRNPVSALNAWLLRKVNDLSGIGTDSISANDLYTDEIQPFIKKFCQSQDETIDPYCRASQK